MSSIEETPWERVLSFPEKFSTLVQEYAAEKPPGKNENAEKIKKEVSECFFSSFSKNIFKCHEPIIIYLDIDGVLLRFDWKSYFTFELTFFVNNGFEENDPRIPVKLFDKEALGSLNSLLRLYEKIAVVVSSAWRINRTPLELRELFPFGKYVIDKTPDFSLKFEPKEKTKERPSEVAQHVKENDVNIFVIFDDCEFDFPLDHFVKVDILSDWDKTQAIQSIYDQSMGKIDYRTLIKKNHKSFFPDI